MIVSRMISWLYFLVSSLAFFLMVLHVSAYSIRCLSSPILTVSRHFTIMTLDALCWIMSVLVSLMVSMSSSFFSVSNRFLNSSWNSTFFDPSWVTSSLGGLFMFFLSAFTSSLLWLHNHSVVSGCLLQTAQTWANAGVCSASCAHAFGCMYVCLFVITCLFYRQFR